MKPFYEHGGKYVTRVKDSQLTQTSNNNTQWVVSFTVLGTPDPNDDSRYIESKVQMDRYFRRVINQNTIEFAIQDMRAFGFAGDSYAQLDSRHPKAWPLKGMEIEMYCQHERDQNGEPKEVWSVARESMSLEQAPADKVRELDYAFGAQLKSLKQQKPAPQAQQTQQQAPQQPARAQRQQPKVQPKPQPVAAGRFETSDEDIPL